MGSSVVFSVSCHKHDIEVVLANLASLKETVYKYGETITDLYIKKDTDFVEEPFYSLTYFSESSEVKILPIDDNVYRLRCITDEPDLWNKTINLLNASEKDNNFSYLEIDNNKERSFYLQPSSSQIYTKLKIALYESELGLFSRWVGVSK